MKDKKPNCPRCKTNINVVKLQIHFRCAFCGEIIRGKPGQQSLVDFGQ